jgi:hypothetical protein
MIVTKFVVFSLTIPAELITFIHPTYATQNDDIHLRIYLFITQRSIITHWTLQLQ